VVVVRVEGRWRGESVGREFQFIVCPEMWIGIVGSLDVQRKNLREYVPIHISGHGSSLKI
jgi:hypothetical protein